MRVKKILFPATNPASICTIQSLAGAGNLTLNGAMVNPVNHVISFIDQGFSHQVIISSINNLSAVNFTVYGMRKGMEVSEVISGPNNGSATTNTFFDSVSGVSASAAAAAVSVGNGGMGAVNAYPLGSYIVSTITSTDGSVSIGSGIYSSLDLDMDANRLAYALNAIVPPYDWRTDYAYTTAAYVDFVQNYYNVSSSLIAVKSNPNAGANITYVLTKISTD